MNSRQKPPSVHTYLIKVYLTVCCSLMASVFGALIHVLCNIGGFITFLATLGYMYRLLNTQKRRFSQLMLFSFLHGVSLGPLIELAIDTDPGIVVIAFVTTAIVFACFSGVAMLTRRRVFLYLGGFLSSSFSVLVWVLFASLIFDDSVVLFIIEYYLGILVFVGYIVADTREIVERAHLGDLDYVTDALLLSTNFISVFVRILIILMKNKSEKEKKKKERKD